MSVSQFDQFSANILNQSVEVSDGSNSYQCMDLAYLWVFCLGYPKATIQNLHAYQALTQPKEITKQYFDIIPYTQGFVPQKGDLGIFGTGVGPSGHICVCNGVGNNVYFESLDQNWSSIKVVKLVRHGYKGFIGVLRPKVVSNDSKAREDRDHWWNNQVKLFQAILPGIEFKESTADSQVEGAIKTIKDERKMLDGQRAYVLQLEERLRNPKAEVEAQSAQLIDQLTSEKNKPQGNYDVLKREHNILQRKVANHVCTIEEKPNNQEKQDLGIISTILNELLKYTKERGI